MRSPTIADRGLPAIAPARYPFVSAGVRATLPLPLIVMIIRDGTDADIRASVIQPIAIDMISNPRIPGT